MAISFVLAETLLYLSSSNLSFCGCCLFFQLGATLGFDWLIWLICTCVVILTIHICIPRYTWGATLCAGGESWGTEHNQRGAHQIYYISAGQAWTQLQGTLWDIQYITVYLHIMQKIHMCTSLHYTPWKLRTNNPHIYLGVLQNGFQDSVGRTWGSWEQCWMSKTARSSDLKI